MYVSVPVRDLQSEELALLIDIDSDEAHIIDQIKKLVGDPRVNGSLASAWRLTAVARLAQPQMVQRGCQK